MLGKRYRNRGVAAALLGWGVVLGGCQSTAVDDSAPLVQAEERPAPVRAAVPVQGELLHSPAAEEMATLLEPYRQGLKEAFGEVLGHSAVTMEHRSPELANFITDAIRAEYNRRHPEAPLHILFINLGSLRSPLPAGEVTLGTVVSIIPFENTLALLPMTGAEFQPLAEVLAQAGGGLPFSGMELVVEGGSVQVLIEGQPIDPDAHYLIGTNNYLASGIMTQLDAYPNKPDTGVLLREFIAGHIRHLEAQGLQVQITTPAERIHFRHVQP